MKIIFTICAFMQGLANPDSFFGLLVGFFIWLIVVAIGAAIISAIIAFIGNVVFDKEFKDVFQKSFTVVEIIGVILGLFTLCS